MIVATNGAGAEAPFAVDPVAAQDGIVMALACILESDSSIQTSRQMREAGEFVGKRVAPQIKGQRQHHLQTGDRAWDGVLVRPN